MCHQRYAIEKEHTVWASVTKINTEPHGILVRALTAITR